MLPVLKRPTVRHDDSRCLTVYIAKGFAFECCFVEAYTTAVRVSAFFCTMNVFSPTGDVVIRNGDEMILTDKNGRRFRKAEHASSASAHVSRKRLNFREPLVLCLLLTQENK